MYKNVQTRSISEINSHASLYDIYSVTFSLSMGLCVASLKLIWQREQLGAMNAKHDNRTVDGEIFSEYLPVLQTGDTKS